MTSGKFRHKVQIQERTGTGSARAWTDVCTVWGEVKTASGRRYAQPDSGLLLRDCTHEVTIRWRSDVKYDNRVVWNGHVLLVESIKEDDTHKKTMTLVCLEDMEMTT